MNYLKVFKQKWIDDTRQMKRTKWNKKENSPNIIEENSPLQRERANSDEIKDMKHEQVSNTFGNSL